jgi:hypothetical protein
VCLVSVQRNGCVLRSGSGESEIESPESLVPHENIGTFFIEYA